MSCKNEGYSLMKKVELENRLKDAADNLLNASTELSDTVYSEASKSLMISEMRLLSYSQELEKQAANKSKPKKHPPVAGPSTAKLILQKSEKFDIFVVAQIDSEICDTSLVSDIGPSNQVAPDFNLCLTIYARQLKEKETLVQTSTKLLKGKLRQSLTRSYGRLLSAYLSNRTQGKHQFFSVGSTSIRLDDLKQLTTAFELSLSSDVRFGLPLFGHICCDIGIELQSEKLPRISGRLDLTNGVHEYKDLWCMLHSSKLSAYFERNSSSSDQPLFVIQISENSVVSFDEENRQIVLEMGSSDDSFALSASSQHFLKRWFTTLEKQILDCKHWGRFAKNCSPPLSLTESPEFAVRYDSVSVDDL
ncbi:unnamed protein product [Soboliphyme baturini]|uniref:PH domain-containing protein n=1 Tax=Soboliphyme baturini TaxID=241478 RepID=A0A183IXG8_9BILA|nr:unnamed protein product [Soboliphyme baturini]